MELRPEDIAEIVRIFNDSELVELRLDIGGHRLYLSKQAGGGPAWEAAVTPPAATPGSPSGPSASSGGTGAPGSAGGAAAARGAGAWGGAAAFEGAGPTPAPGGEAQAEPAPVSQEVPPASAANLVDLKSPLLGVFYRRPAPDQQPFVEIGSEVGPDDPVCIIDVMKMFSRVPAGAAGRVAEILVEDGQLVEHGQVLMRLEPR